MNLAEAKKRALSLMAEFSLDGVVIPDGENADYLNRMSRYASDAQTEISDKISVEASFVFEQQGSNEQGFNKHPLPKDVKEIKYMMLNDYPFSAFTVRNRQIWVNKSVSGTLELFYDKIPTLLDSSTPDTYEFELDEHVQHLIPYYLGGMALLDESPAISDKLLNLYYSKLQALSKREMDYPSYIESVYNI